MGPHRSITNFRGRLSEIVFDAASSTFDAELLEHPFFAALDAGFEVEPEDAPRAAAGSAPEVLAASAPDGPGIGAEAR